MAAVIGQVVGHKVRHVRTPLRGADPPGDRSRDLRQGPRAAGAADAASRARRRRLDGEPPRRGLSYGRARFVVSVCTANGALSFFTLAVYQGYLEEFK